MIAALPYLCPAPLGVIVGEPSGLRAVLAHKGKAAARLAVTGRSGHSSRPDLGLNSIHAMTVVLSRGGGAGARLEGGRSIRLRAALLLAADRIVMGATRST